MALSRSRSVSVLSALSSGLSFARRPQLQTLSPVDDRGWWHQIFDWAPGAWQRDEDPVNVDKVLAHWAVFACISLISGDAGKIPLLLVEKNEDGTWDEAESPAFSPVLRKPNHYQTLQQFIETWVISKLSRGNTYILKEYDNRSVIRALYILDPNLVTPLVAPNGSVFYRVGEDHLSGITEEMVAVPAIDMMHDRFNCFFHPLVGLSPLFASGLAAKQGLSIQQNSEKFFSNMSRPSGILTAPKEISDPLAARLKEQWEKNYASGQIGKVAVLGDGLKYEAMGVSAEDSQLAEQMSLTAKMVCSTFHVPPFKIGIEALPGGQKVDDMNRIYYADCLHKLFQAIETLLERGLFLDESARGLGVMFDVDDLTRMDTAAQIDMLAKATGAGIMKINEARSKRNLKPAEGGDDCFLQQQYWALRQLAERKSAPDGASPASASPDTTDTEDDASTQNQGSNQPAPEPSQESLRTAVVAEVGKVVAQIKQQHAADEQRARDEASRLLARITKGLAP